MLLNSWTTPVSVYVLPIDSITPVSNPRMAKWPQHSTETFESIPRGKPQNGRATYGVRESLSFVYFESYLHDFFLMIENTFVYPAQAFFLF